MKLIVGGTLLLTGLALSACNEVVAVSDVPRYRAETCQVTKFKPEAFAVGELVSVVIEGKDHIKYQAEGRVVDIPDYKFKEVAAKFRIFDMCAVVPTLEIDLGGEIISIPSLKTFEPVP